MYGRHSDFYDYVGRHTCAITCGKERLSFLHLPTQEECSRDGICRSGRGGDLRAPRGATTQITCFKNVLPCYIWMHGRDSFAITLRHYTQYLRYKFHRCIFKISDRLFRRGSAAVQQCCSTAYLPLFTADYFKILSNKRCGFVTKFSHKLFEKFNLSQISML